LCAHQIFHIAKWFASWKRLQSNSKYAVKINSSTPPAIKPDDLSANAASKKFSREAAVIAPSGEQITITAGDQHAVVVEVGGGLRSYSASKRELVDGYGANEMSSSGRGKY